MVTREHLLHFRCGARHFAPSHVHRAGGYTPEPRSTAWRRKTNLLEKPQSQTCLTFSQTHTAPARGGSGRQESWAEGTRKPRALAGPGQSVRVKEGPEPRCAVRNAGLAWMCRHQSKCHYKIWAEGRFLVCSGM